MRYKVVNTFDNPAPGTQQLMKQSVVILSTIPKMKVNGTWA